MTLRPPLLMALLLLGAIASDCAAPRRSLAAPEGVQRPGRGADGPQAEPLPPPAALPPPLMQEQLGDERAAVGAELTDAEALDALAIRALRAAREQLRMGEAPCERGRAGQRAASMAWSEARARLQTADALTSEDGIGGLGERRRALAARVDSSDVSLGELAADLAPRCPDAPPAAPRPWLPREARDPAVGRVVIFVAGGAASRVVWVGQRPSAVTDEDGWAVAVVPPGSVLLCASPPEATSCSPGVEVEARMGAAFDLAGAFAPTVSP